jgi:hypothetical protein
MSKKQFHILLSILFISILFFSNPSEEAHIQSVKSKLQIAFNKKMSTEKIKNNPFYDFGKLLGDSFIDKLTEGLIARENFFLFSLTNVEFNGRKKTIGIGILGYVYVSDKIVSVFKENEEK